MEDALANSITLTFSWCYALLFIISLYWQVFSTWRWRSSAGLSFEWVQFTFFGYTSFFVLSWWMYFSKDERDSFEENFPGIIYPIHISDIILSANGCFIMLIIMIQHISYRRDISRKYSVLGVLILILMWFTFFFLGLLTLIPETNLDTTAYFRAVAVIFCVSVAFRYIPQISLIFRMRSTKGWSMELVYCQFVGAWFLIAKVIFDACASSSWEVYAGNLVQLIVAILVLFFSIILVLQRFTCCSDKEMKPTRKQIITEQAILSDRIYYEDEIPPRPQIKPHKIFDEYDPDIVGRVTERDNRLSRNSMTSSFSASDSDWDYRTDDDISSLPL